jgi:hypothetical protein
MIWGKCKACGTPCYQTFESRYALCQSCTDLHNAHALMAQAHALIRRDRKSVV